MDIPGQTSITEDPTRHERVVLAIDENFDQRKYSIKSSDVAAAVAHRVPNGYDHFRRIGYLEGERYAPNTSITCGGNACRRQI
jgi:hypothetical protein